MYWVRTVIGREEIVLKKITTIITAILLLSFAAFAGSIESHTVRVSTEVATVMPAFQFEFTRGMLDPSGRVATTDGDGEFSTNETAVEVADISVTGLDLVFTARLANAAKCEKAYTLKFTAGGFDVMRNGTRGRLDPKSSVISVKGVSLVGFIVETVSPDTIRLIFNGDDCEQCDIATFNVSYAPDASLDPTENGEFYYADISLEISSD